ncbi:hypothetical protein ABZX69_44725 [Streptomyces sp. NPDC004074]|uniref:hypothetical protein n=1 Tax=unclassified Streptomyces TaxID=2593676 RepID=UPI0033A20054
MTARRRRRRRVLDRRRQQLLVVEDTGSEVTAAPDATGDGCCTGQAAGDTSAASGCACGQ